jgi:hypothetical protein
VFAALLGYNPVQHLLHGTGVLATLTPHQVAVLTGNQFFPNLISAPFHRGLIIVFSAAAAMSLIGAAVSLLRGAQFYWEDTPVEVPAPAPAPPSAPESQPVAGSGSQSVPEGTR